MGIIIYIFQKFMKLPYYLVICIILICPLLLSAQSKTGKIQGNVIDESTGELLIGANVYLNSDTTKKSSSFYGSVTNLNGFFEISGIPFGKYFIFASLMGYSTSVNEVHITEDNKLIRMDFELSKKSFQLNEVIISDRRITDFSKTTSTIEIKPEMIQQLPSMGGETDIFRALLLLPGVQAATEISTGIYVRGGSPDQNLTLVDGVVVYNPSHLGGFSSTFNSDALKNVKLLKGAFPAEYGGRLSSVLDVRMKEGVKERISGNLGLNLMSARMTVEGPLDTNSSFIISARKMFLDKVIGVIPEASSIPRYNFLDFNGKMNYSAGDKNRIMISGFYSQDNLQEPPSNKDYNFDIKWGNSTVNLTWTEIKSMSMYTNTSLMYTNYSFSTLIKDKQQSIARQEDFFTSSRINDFLFKREMEFYLGEAHSIKTGVEAIYHNFTTTTSDFYIRELNFNDSYATMIKAFEASFYVQDEVQISTDLKGNLGGRLVYFHNGKYMNFEPRVSVTYFVFDRFTLRGAFAYSNQNLHMISRNDIFLPSDVWYPSTGKIKPSRAVQGSVGFETTSIDRSFLFSLDAYYKSMLNLYEYKESATFEYNSPFDEKLTPGTGESYGLEFFLNKRLGNMSGWVGYTLSYTSRHFDELNKGLIFYPRYDRRHDISLALTYNLASNFTIGSTWTYGTGQAYSLPIGQYSFGNVFNPAALNSLYYEYSARDGYRLPAFHKMDLSVQYEVKWNRSSLEFSLDIYNVYNRYNVFSKYIGYKIDESGEKKWVLRQFTLFPFLPTIGVNYKF